MRFQSGVDRNQPLLLPPSIDDYVAQDSAVRFIDAFVDSLNLSSLGFHFPEQDAQGRGRPGYHPALLLKIFIYGYTYRIRSGRLLEHYCKLNLDLIWLTGNLAPDHKTICDFRKNNALAFTKAIQEFTHVCRKLDLFGSELIAIDGTKIKGQNSPANNFSQTKLEREQKRIAERVEEYLKLLEKAENSEPVPRQHSAEELKEKIKQLAQRKEEVETRLKEVQESGQSQKSLTDPDSRSMKTSQGYVVGFNAQAAVDAKHHLIVTLEATSQCVDQGQLVRVIESAQAVLELPSSCKVVADGGYNIFKDIKTCEDREIQVHMPRINPSVNGAKGLYGREDFVYDPQKDSYTCPNKVELAYQKTLNTGTGKMHNYSNFKACRECLLRSRCTTSRHRIVTRSEHQEEVDRMNQRVQQQPEILQKRKTIVEHVHGTIKWLLPGGFLVKGLKKVQAELSLAHFAYNFRRASKVLGLAKMIATL